MPLQQTGPKLVFGPTFAMMPSLLRMCRRRCAPASKIVFLVFPQAGYVNSRYAPTRLLILKTLPGPPASKFTWRRRRVAPALWSLFKLPRASDTFNIANVGVALPLKVLLEFWGSRKPVPCPILCTLSFTHIPSSSITLMRLPIKLAGVGGGA
ncbi:hypothetical protein C8R43DRAFT_950728 [Mycena crocata]|nr:hypothetical protein C8R43DRAFT_950728 [Mycena crocata]